VKRWFVNERSWLLLLLILALAVRLPNALIPPVSGIYNVDELDLLFTVLGLSAGQTPINLQWPAGTLIFLLLPVTAVDYLLELARSGNLGALRDFGVLTTSFTVFLGQIFYAPRDLLVISRTIVALISALTPVAVYLALRGQVQRLVSFTFALVLAVSPLLVTETAILKGDAFGVLFYALSLVFALRFMQDARPENDRWSTWGFLLLGLAVASRFTYLVLFPFLLVLILARVWTSGRDGRWKRLALVIARDIVAFALPILIFVPFVWTSPITTAKSFAGNLLFLTTLNTGDAARGALLNSIVSMVGLPALILTLLGFFWIWRETKRLAAFTVLALFGLVFIPLARSGFVEGRYTLPLLPPLALWTGYGALACWKLLSERAERVAEVVIAVLLVLSVLIAGYQIGGVFFGQHAETGASQMAAWLLDHSRESDRIAVPMSMQVYLPLNKNGLTRILAAYANDPTSAETRLLQLLNEVHLSNGGVTTLPGFMIEAWFGEDERMDRFRYAAMQFAAEAGASPDNARDVLYYEFGTPEKPDRISADDAQAQFASGAIDFLVTDATRLVPGGSARQLVCFSNTCVYGKP